MIGKSELVMVNSSSAPKIESALKEGKRVLLYQYALLEDEHIKKVK